MSHDQQTIDQGLLAIAYAGGLRRAERDLAEMGIKVSHSTLGKWREKYPERYAEMEAKALPEVMEKAQARHAALMVMQADVSIAITEELDKERGGLEPRDKINALGKLDVGTGIHTEKALLLSGRPTNIVQRTSDEVLRDLAAAMGVDTVEGEVTAEELVKEIEEG